MQCSRAMGVGNKFVITPLLMCFIQFIDRALWPQHWMQPVVQSTQMLVLVQFVLSCIIHGGISTLVASYVCSCAWLTFFLSTLPWFHEQDLWMPLKNWEAKSKFISHTVTLVDHNLFCGIMNLLTLNTWNKSHLDVQVQKHFTKTVLAAP